jgi:hypothetical protein
LPQPQGRSRADLRSAVSVTGVRLRIAAPRHDVHTWQRGPDEASRDSAPGPTERRRCPSSSFLEVDAYDSTHELLAIIRGSDGGKKMYSPGDALPDIYAQRFRTELYSDRVACPRSWNVLAVIAHEDDHATILTTRSCGHDAEETYNRARRAGKQPTR